VEALHLPLLLVGYAAGVAFYVALAVGLWRVGRSWAAALVAFYWRRRSRREAVATIRRVSDAQRQPARRAA
jgi:hypothetical protein